MFEKASKLKLRFDSVRGKLSTEQLWDLPLTSRDGFDLDTIAKEVNKKIKTLEEESFVNVKSNISSTFNLKLNILKHIIAYKIKFIEEREEIATKKEKRERILEIIAKKEDSSLESKTLEELQAELKEL